jgi:hypothetical protein
MLRTYIVTIISVLWYMFRRLSELIELPSFLSTALLWQLRRHASGRNKRPRLRIAGGPTSSAAHSPHCIRTHLLVTPTPTFSFGGLIQELFRITEGHFLAGHCVPSPGANSLVRSIGLYGDTILYVFTCIRQSPWPLVRKRTIPTDRPPPVGEF